MHTNTLCQKLDKVIAMVFFRSIIHQLAGQRIKGFRYGSRGKSACSTVRIFGEVLAWRKMVAAVINPVAFAYMVGEGSTCFGIDIAFKSMLAMAAARASVPAAPAVVRFKGVTVHV
jgi:hypothetical protein